MPALEATALLVLAAGLSRRFGTTNKLMAPFRGKPLALHLADQVAQAPFAHKLALCLKDDQDLQTAFADRGFTSLANPDSTRGQASSLALGVTRLIEYQPQAILVCLADMPFVTLAHLHAVIAGLGGDATIAASRLPDGQAGPPAAFAPAHFGALARLEGDKGARSLLRDAFLIDAPAGMLADLDTPADFAAQG